MSGQSGQQSGRVQTNGDDASGGARARQASSNSDLLLPGEEVLIDARPAWSAWTSVLVLAGLIVIGSLITGESTMIALGLVVGLAIVGWVAYQRRKVRYLVTDNRVMVITGLSSRKTNEAWLEDVKGMQTGASFIERVLGHGHITVSRDILPTGALLGRRFGTAGMTLGGIKNYEQIADVIRRRQSERKIG